MRFFFVCCFAFTSFPFRSPQSWHFVELRSSSATLCSVTCFTHVANKKQLSLIAYLLRLCWWVTPPVRARLIAAKRRREPREGLSAAESEWRRPRAPQHERVSASCGTVEARSRWFVVAESSSGVQCSQSVSIVERNWLSDFLLAFRSVFLTPLVCTKSLAPC